MFLNLYRRRFVATNPVARASNDRSTQLEPLEPRRLLVSGPPTDFVAREAVFDEADTLHIMFVDAQQQLWYAARNDAQIWSDHALIDDTGRVDADHFDVELDHRGRPVVAYRLAADEAAGETSEMWVSRLEDNGWMAQRLGLGGSTGLYPSLAGDDSGLLYVSHFRKQSGDHVVHTFLPGDNPVRHVLATGGERGRLADVAIDVAGGDAVIAYRNGDDTLELVRGSLARWSTPMNVATQVFEDVSINTSWQVVNGIAVPHYAIASATSTDLYLHDSDDFRDESAWSSRIIDAGVSAQNLAVMLDTEQADVVYFTDPVNQTAEAVLRRDTGSGTWEPYVLASGVRSWKPIVKAGGGVAFLDDNLGDGDVPLTPNNFTAELLAGGDVSLTWVNDAASETLIERRADSGPWTQLVRLDNTTSGYIDRSASEASVYEYRAIAQSVQGLISPPTENQSIAPSPLAPTNISATLMDLDTVLLGWVDNSVVETGYVIERALNGGAFEVIGETAADVDSFVDEITAGALAEYRITTVFNDLRTIGEIQPEIQLPETTHVEAEDFDAGGQGVSYNDLTPGNTGDSPYRAAEDVDLTVGHDGNVLLTDFTAGEWVDFTVDVPASWPYRLKLRGAVPVLAGGTELRVESPDGDFTPRDFTVPTGPAGLTEFATFDLGTTTLMAGPVTLRLSVISMPLPGQEIALDALSVEPIRTLATDITSTAVLTATSALTSVLNAVDNDPFTAWSPTGFVQNHVELDLGAARLIERMQLNWAVDTGIDYVVQLSADGLDFVSVEGHAGSVRDGRMDLIEDIDVTARYVRIVYLGDDLLTALPQLTDVKIFAE